MRSARCTRFWADAHLHTPLMRFSSLICARHLRNSVLPCMMEYRRIKSEFYQIKSSPRLQRLSCICYYYYSLLLSADSCNSGTVEARRLKFVGETLSRLRKGEQVTKHFESADSVASRRRDVSFDLFAVCTCECTRIYGVSIIVRLLNALRNFALRKCQNEWMNRSLA